MPGENVKHFLENIKYHASKVLKLFMCVKKVIPFLEMYSKKIIIAKNKNK